MKFWHALLIIPGGWLASFAIGCWCQAHGIGLF
jgi:hypothetical protein